MQPRPYKLFGAHERAAARAGALERIAPWVSAWLPAGDTVRIECAPAHQAGGALRDERSGWVRFADSPEQWLAYRATAAAVEALAGAIYGGSGSEVAAEAAAGALRELGCALLGPGSAPRDPRRGEDAAPGPHTWMKGSACLALGVHVSGAKIDFISSAGWALELLAGRLPRGARPPLVERALAVESQRVALRVLAGAAELDLKAFNALTIGDVIALDTPIDRPLDVVVAVGRQRTVCAGRLGRAAGHKAVALASPGA